MHIYKQNKVTSLDIKNIRPMGWMKDQLELQLHGITLNLDETWGSVSKFSDWIGGTNISWERPPYWLDGLVPLAYLLQHEEGMKKAQHWLEWSLQSQRDNGDFGPSYYMVTFDETLFWPKFVMLKAMISYYEAIHEERILSFMTKYMHFCDQVLEDYTMNGWAQARAGDLVHVIYWLYEHTNEDFLLALAKKVNAQSMNWTGFLENLPFTQPVGYYYEWKRMDRNVSRKELYDVMQYHATHIVNVTMGLKQPIMEYKATGEQKYLDAIYTGMESLWKHHGQVSGIYSGDEHLSGVKPTQGSELCSVVEFMFSLRIIFEQTKDTRFLDLLERIAYNALPATICEDFKGHQYDQQANQVKVSEEPRDWYNNGDRANIFGFEPNFGCCLANMHQGWPKLLKSAIFQEANHIYMGVYMPMEASLSIEKAKVRIKEVCEYPFKDEIHWELQSDKPVMLELHLRIPAWCKQPSVWVNDQRQTIDIADGFVCLHLSVEHVMQIKLQLPMEVILHKGWYHNAVSVERGPLIFGLNIAEKWVKLAYGHKDYPDYEIYPESAWNFALDTSSQIRVEVANHLQQQAFTKQSPPVRMYIKGRQLDDWGMENNSAQDLPQSPVICKGELIELELIPYGCAKLRISLFPWQ